MILRSGAKSRRVGLSETPPELSRLDDEAAHGFFVLALQEELGGQAVVEAFFVRARTKRAAEEALALFKQICVCAGAGKTHLFVKIFID